MSRAREVLYSKERNEIRNKFGPEEEDDGADELANEFRRLGEF